MATITSGGIGSGLDVNGIVDKLMALERKPLATFDQKQNSYQTKLSAFGVLKSNLASLQSAAIVLSTESTFISNTAAVSDSTVLSASASTAAATGSYSLSVTQLAKYHAVRSNTDYAATTDTFNTGTLAISIGGATAVNVTIDGSNNTLAGIRQAINDASAGVTATIVNDGTTNRLILTSKTSGSVGAINVTVSDDGGGGSNALSQLDTASLVDVQTADNALFTINGLSVSRSSNTVTDVVDGLTLNLTKGTGASPGVATVTVARDTAAISGAIETFVKAFNTAIDHMKSSSAYNSITKTGASLYGEGTVRSIRTDMGALAFASVSGVTGGIDSLSSIGISVQLNGSLAIDSTKLKAAVADSSKDIKSLFGQTTVGNEGIAVKFGNALAPLIAGDGYIAGRTDGLTSASSYIDKQRIDLNARLTKIETRHRATYARLDAMIASMNQTQQAMSSQMDSLTNSGN
jgi:flagellar hook-associated protein 2